METKEVVLKSGKKLVIRELSALEDTLAYRMVGPEFDGNNHFAGGVTVRSIQIALSIVKVDDKDVAPLRKLEDIFEFMAKFSKKEWSKVTEAYMDLNEADDEEGE